MTDHNSGEFNPFPKLYRLFREIVISEKIDGTNAQIVITDSGEIRAGSRNKWVTPKDDNAGFAKWVEANQEELKRLGPGQHFGEWWGAGIQRNYGLKEKRFSLFNTHRWGEGRPACCGVVPVLYQGMFSEQAIKETMEGLEKNGSVASPGFMKPEGLVIFHVHSGEIFKYTLNGDGHKG